MLCAFCAANKSESREEKEKQAHPDFDFFSVQSPHHRFDILDELSGSFLDDQAQYSFSHLGHLLNATFFHC